MVSLDNYVSRNTAVPWRVIEGEAILVDVSAGKVIQASQTAAFIWEQLDGSKTIGEIIDRVCADFAVEKERARQDTLEFLEELIRKKLIRVK